MKEVFRNAIIPLLQEYFYDDYEKIALVLGDDKFNYSEDNCFVIKKSVPTAFKGKNFDEDVKYAHPFCKKCFSSMDYLEDVYTHHADKGADEMLQMYLKAEGAT